MAISQPRTAILVLDAATTTGEKNSSVFDVHPAATQVNLQVIMTQAGTLDVDWVDMTGAAHQISTTAVVANTALTVSLAYNPGKVRARFTPNAQPVTGRIEASYAGHAGGLA